MSILILYEVGGDGKFTRRGNCGAFFDNRFSFLSSGVDGAGDGGDMAGADPQGVINQGHDAKMKAIDDCWKIIHERYNEGLGHAQDHSACAAAAICLPPGQYIYTPRCVLDPNRLIDVQETVNQAGQSWEFPITFDIYHEEWLVDRIMDEKRDLDPPWDRQMAQQEYNRRRELAQAQFVSGSSMFVVPTGCRPASLFAKCKTVQIQEHPFAEMRRHAEAEASASTSTTAADAGAREPVVRDIFEMHTDGDAQDPNVCGALTLVTSAPPFGAAADTAAAMDTEFIRIKPDGGYAVSRTIYHELVGKGLVPDQSHNPYAHDNWFDIEAGVLLVVEECPFMDATAETTHANLENVVVNPDDEGCDENNLEDVNSACTVETAASNPATASPDPIEPSMTKSWTSRGTLKVQCWCDHAMCSWHAEAPEAAQSQGLVCDPANSWQMPVGLSEDPPGTGNWYRVSDVETFHDGDAGMEVRVVTAPEEPDSHHNGEHGSKGHACYHPMTTVDGQYLHAPPLRFHRVTVEVFRHGNDLDATADEFMSYEFKKYTPDSVQSYRDIRFWRMKAFEMSTPDADEIFGDGVPNDSGSNSKYDSVVDLDPAQAKQQLEALHYLLDSDPLWPGDSTGVPGGEPNGFGDHSNNGNIAASAEVAAAANTVYDNIISEVLDCMTSGGTNCGGPGGGEYSVGGSGGFSGGGYSGGGYSGGGYGAGDFQYATGANTAAGDTGYVTGGRRRALQSGDRKARRTPARKIGTAGPGHRGPSVSGGHPWAGVHHSGIPDRKSDVPAWTRRLKSGERRPGMLAADLKERVAVGARLKSKGLHPAQLRRAVLRRKIMLGQTLRRRGRTLDSSAVYDDMTNENQFSTTAGQGGPISKYDFDAEGPNGERYSSGWASDVSQCRMRFNDQGYQMCSGAPCAFGCESKSAMPGEMADHAGQCRLPPGMRHKSSEAATATTRRLHAARKLADRDLSGTTKPVRTNVLERALKHVQTTPAHKSSGMRKTKTPRRMFAVPDEAKHGKPLFDVPLSWSELRHAERRERRLRREKSRGLAGSGPTADKKRADVAVAKQVFLDRLRQNGKPALAAALRQFDEAWLNDATAENAYRTGKSAHIRRRALFDEAQGRTLFDEQGLTDFMSSGGDGEFDPVRMAEESADRSMEVAHTLEDIIAASKADIFCDGPETTCIVEICERQDMSTLYPARRLMDAGRRRNLLADQSQKIRNLDINIELFGRMKNETQVHCAELVQTKSGMLANMPSNPSLNDLEFSMEIFMEYLYRLEEMEHSVCVHEFDEHSKQLQRLHQEKREAEDAQRIFLQTEQKIYDIGERIQNIENNLTTLEMHAETAAHKLAQATAAHDRWARENAEMQIDLDQQDIMAKEREKRVLLRMADALTVMDQMAHGPAVQNMCAFKMFDQQFGEGVVRDCHVEYFEGVPVKHLMTMFVPLDCK